MPKTETATQKITGLAAKQEAAREKMRQEILAEVLASSQTVIDLDVELCNPNPYQPRTDLGDIQELADSLSVEQYHPIVVRQVEGRYEVADGWRRLTATKTLLKRTHIKALVAAYDDKQMARLAVVTSNDRKALNPIEEMRAFQRWKAVFGWTYKQIAKEVGRSEDYVTNRMRASRWTEELVELVEGSQLEFSVAVELNAIKLPMVRADLTNVVQTENLSLHALRERIAVCEAAWMATDLLELERMKLYNKALHGKVTLEQVHKAIAKAKDASVAPQEAQEGTAEAPVPESDVKRLVKRILDGLDDADLGEWLRYGEELLQKRAPDTLTGDQAKV